MEVYEEARSQYGRYVERPMPEEKRKLTGEIIKAIEAVLYDISEDDVDYNTLEIIIHTNGNSFTVGAKFFKKRGQ